MCKSELTIIVLNYKNFDVTQQCVDNLIAIKVNANIVIVDNDSPNNAFKILYDYYLHRENISVIRNKKNGGYANGNNFGFKYAEAKFPETKYLCVMNPDVLVVNNYFEELCNELGLSEQYVAITSMMVWGDKVDFSTITWDIPNEKELYRNQAIWKKRMDRGKMQYSMVHDGVIEGEVLPGSFFIIKKKVFEQVGYFDEGTFLYNEENILAIKLKKMGYNCLVSTKYYYLHLHNIPSKEMIRDRYINDFKTIIESNKISFNSRKYLCKKYYKSKNIVYLYIIHFLNVTLLYIKRILLLTRII